MVSADVAIVGGGPAGAVTALHLLAAGLKPVIVEKETFPRYHIGESLTGECGACLRELGLEEQMAAIGWPIKHGVTVYGAGAQNSFWVPVKKRNAQHELETTSTWQVRRSDFDKMLLDTAIARGAQHLHAKALSPIIEETGKVSGLVYEADDGSTQSLQCKVLVDASGQAGFLANRSTLTSGKERGRYDSQIAVFTQVRNAKRDTGDAAGNTLIFVGKPYQWAWFIPLDEHTTSVGVVVPREYFRARAGSPEDFLRGEFLSLNPELARRLADAEIVEEVRSLTNYSYQVRNFTGDGFLCVGDAHRFIDPIFSFGVYFAIKEAGFAANAIIQALQENETPAPDAFSAYERLVERGQNAIQDLLDCFWQKPLIFMIFAHYQHRDGVIDLFAGRLYHESIEEMPVLKAIREQLRPKTRAA